MKTSFLIFLICFTLVFPGGIWAAESVHQMAVEKPKASESIQSVLQELSQNASDSQDILDDKESSEDPLKLDDMEIMGNSTKMDIIAGKSQVITFNHNIIRLAVSNPDLADAVVLGKKEFLLNTRKAGTANMIVWDENKRRFVIQLNITNDPTPLMNALNSMNPDNDLKVFPTEKGFVVKGDVSTVEEQNRISDATKAFATNSVSVVKVKDAKQILLEVRFIEVNRSTGFSFGIDGHYIGEKVGLAFLTGGTGSALGGDGLTDGLISAAGSTFGFPGLDHSNGSPNYAFGTQNNSSRLQTYLKALESKNLLKVIARPNLLVRDGEEASFLVGGEFPVPTVTQNTVDVSYKEFGTKLVYKPEIFGNNKIRLKVAGEVSQLDYANAVTINGFSIPALSSRKTDTLVELESGNSLVVGGLIQQRITKINSGTPGLRKVPLLGKLFSSTEDAKTDVELIVVVTPWIIDASKESYDLNRVKWGDAIHGALESENPPFEDDRALSIESELNRHEKGRLGKDNVELRTIKRTKLFEKAKNKKLGKREKEFDHAVEELLRRQAG